MKRFYKEAAAEPVESGWRVTLDGRPVRTPRGAPQLLPTGRLAAAMAREWQDQGDELDPARLRLRDLADHAIDIVAATPAASVTRLLGYAETDTLCYRADPDEPLFRRQREQWDPLLATFEAREGVVLVRVSGIIHRAQPAATMARLKVRLERLDPFQLAALEVMTSLAASLCIGLSALEPDADGEALWRAANLEEDWQVEQWGEDGEAAARRARRGREFLDALEFARLARG